MCLYDMDKRKIIKHNEALNSILGIITEKNHQMVETSILRRKKHNLVDKNDKS